MGTLPPTTRRTLLKNSAWTVPAVVVASAAPAFANSACLPMSYQLNWGQQGAWTYQLTGPANPGNGTGTITATPVGTPEPGQQLDPLPITFINTFHGRMQRAGNLTTEGNMVVAQHGVGGTGVRGLEMWQQQSSSTARSAGTVHNDRQVIMFDFGRPVTNLTFTISDIDAYRTNQTNTSQYRDAVYVSQAPTSVVLGNQVIGNGTQASPWTSRSLPGTGTALDNTTGSGGNVRLTYDGPIQALSVTFYNTETRPLTSSGSQAIYFTNFSFNANSCV